ncbi:MAG TPA: cation diffusion facilitator family transporter [Actinomycetes bacterium]|nr:cation diffusion facilitator family transporter [Actinomycetes bacterium]
MGVAHNHGSSASAGGVHRGRLLVVLAITGAVLIVEVIGAAVTGSLALLADAGHMLTDVAGIGLAILAVTFATRAATPQRSFGYYRLEILAAVVNAVLLMAVAGVIAVEAWQRWSSPPDVEAGLMLVFAAIGVVANLAGMLLLRDGASSSLNVKGAYLETFSDLLGSAAVIAAAVIILATGWLRADVVASMLVALMILPRTWALLRDAVDVLLEATPKGIDVEDVRSHILTTPGVIAAHDLHIWTITSGMPVLSVHVVVSDEELAQGGPGRVLDHLGQCLSDHFDVEHCTFQIEPAGHFDHEHARHI